MEYLAQLSTLAGIVLLACIQPQPGLCGSHLHALHSRRSGIWVGFGIACAVAIWATLTILSFGLLIREMFWLYEFIRLAGAAYLTYLGARMLISAFRKNSNTPTGSRFRRQMHHQATAHGNVECSSA